MGNEKKKKESIFESILHSKGAYYIYDASKKFFESFFETVRENIESTIRFASQYIGSYIFFLVGVLFVLASIAILLEEYFNISFGWSLLVFGLILLIVSLFMRLNLEKKKR